MGCLSVRMRGPLAVYQDAIWSALLGRGYTPLSAKNLLRVAAHLSRWLEAEGFCPLDLTPARIDSFLEHRVRCGYTCWRTSRGLDPILEPLRSLGVVPTGFTPEPDASPLGQLLQEYERYLQQDRGLVARTIAAYVGEARRLLVELGVGEVLRLRQLSAADISELVVREVRSMSVGSAKLMVTRLRSFLRFLAMRGICMDLSAAAPAVAGHRLSRLPRHIPWAEVQRLVESCDPGTPVGRRDQAIVLLLARLGLRACEVAALELGDIRWASGEILVHGKGSHDARLPLPQEVGDAIVRHLESGRPRSNSRRLFLGSNAPHRELSAGAIQAVVADASRRARLPRRSAHQLRHTAATQMLRRGAGLQAVAEVLRHSSIDTTAIYAKVDHRALRPLARPWPGGVA